MPSLIVEPEEHSSETLGVNLGRKTFPGCVQGVGGRSTSVVGVIEVLDDGFAGRLESLRPGDVVKPEKEIVGCCVKGFVHGGDLRSVLASVASTVPDCAVHADRVVICACPLHMLSV